MFGSVFIGIFISIILFGVISVILRRKQYKADIGFLLIVILYFIGEILFFGSFVLSTEILFNLIEVKIIFSISIVCRVLSTILWSSSHSSQLFKTSKIKFLPIIIYLFLLGVISSLILLPNSISSLISDMNYIFIFNSFSLLLFLLIFHFSSLVILWITQIKGFKNFSDRDLAQFNNYYIILLSISTLLYIFYLVSMNPFLRFLNFTFYLIAFYIIVFIIISKPNLFLVYTNRIYDLIIFHKSGILLYSYNFQEGKEVDEQSLKGNILIGISHIMGNLSNIENQLTHIKMKDKAIVFNFNKELGFAIFLVVKHKNLILEDSVNKFMNQFSQIYEENIKNLKGLIDISGFENTKELIHQNFKHYMQK